MYIQRLLNLCLSSPCSQEVEIARNLAFWSAAIILNCQEWCIKGRVLSLCTSARWHLESRQDLILSINSNAMFYNLLKSIASFKNIKITCLALLSEKIKLDIKFKRTQIIIILEYTFQNMQTLTHTIGESGFTPAILPPSALRSTIESQFQTKNRHKVLVGGFTRRLGRLRRWKKSCLWIQIWLFGLLTYWPPNWIGKLEIWSELTIVFIDKNRDIKANENTLNR